MTEDEAHQWIIDRFGVSRETRLAAYAALLVEEAARQNLIAVSTIPQLWSRHLVDSAQLVEHALGDGLWLDIGSGAGLPGLVAALLTDRPVALVEPRKRRVDFLRTCIDTLELQAHVTLHMRDVRQISTPSPAIISARAVAPLPDLLAWSHPLAGPDTRWVLPKGRSAKTEVAAAKRTWHGQFQLMPSVTDPDARIVLIRRAAPR